ncbi:MAG: mandelate racemase/muconate lactonizing enzyme family protein [Bosea sp. (in: a-proteobacteria)]
MLVPVIAGDTARWVRRSHIDRTIVEIETADGLVGIGEARTVWAAKTIAERFAPAITGLSALDRDLIRSRCLPGRIDYGFPERDCDRLAYAAIDLALWDLLGQAEGKPLYQLLGGKARERSLFCAWGYPPDPEMGFVPKDVPASLAVQATRAVQLTGSDLFEFKVARYDAATDIETVRVVRTALGPGIGIAVDANMTYTPDEARLFLRGASPFGLANIEEPVRSLKEMSVLGQEFGVPVSTHCLDPDIADAFPGITALVPDIGVLGGLSETMAMMAEAARRGRRTWLRAMWELGISWAAMCHMGIASHAITRPSQSLIDYAEDDLVDGEPWTVRGGGVIVPARPGLGVTLDRKALQRFRID